LSIADALSGAIKYLAEHPEEARYRDSAARARVVDGLAVSVDGPDGATMQTDMPSGVGGANSAPSPGWFLRAAEAACVASLIVIRAAALGIELGQVEVEVDSESDDRGILGMDEAIPAGPLSTRISVRIEAPGRERDEIVELCGWAVDHCPVTDAVRRAIPLEIDVRVGTAAR
jgi:uncharacterized OsmC-like protein